MKGHPMSDHDKMREALRVLDILKQRYNPVMGDDGFNILKRHIEALAAAPSPQAQAEWARNGIADFIADNWPDRKHSLEEIERGIRTIEIRVPAAMKGPA